MVVLIYFKTASCLYKIQLFGVWYLAFEDWKSLKTPPCVFETRCCILANYDLVMSLVLLVAYSCPHFALCALPHLVTATCFAVDAWILTCHNLHIIASDGNTCGAIVTREAATKIKTRVNTKNKKQQLKNTVHPKSIYRALLFEQSDALQLYSNVDKKKCFLKIHTLTFCSNCTMCSPLMHRPCPLCMSGSGLDYSVQLWLWHKKKEFFCRFVLALIALKRLPVGSSSRSQWPGWDGPWRILCSFLRQQELSKAPPRRERAADDLAGIVDHPLQPFLVSSHAAGERCTCQDALYWATGELWSSGRVTIRVFFCHLPDSPQFGCPFQIMSNQLTLQQLDGLQSISWNMMHLCSMLCFMAKAVNTSVKFNVVIMSCCV